MINVIDEVIIHIDNKDVDAIFAKCGPASSASIILGVIIPLIEIIMVAVADII